MIRPRAYGPAGLYPRLAFYALLILSAGPLPARTVQVERSHPKPPRWSVQVPEADEVYLYYVGRATGAASLEAAETDAAAEVVRQIVTELGLEAWFSYDRLRSEAGLLLTDRIGLSGDSRIIGLKRVETYYIKQLAERGNTVKTTYDASLLARYPRESFEREVERLNQEAAARAAEAEKRLAAAQEFERKGAWDAAWAGVTAILELTAIPAPRASAGDLRRMLASRQKAADLGRRLGPRLRRLAIRPVEILAAENGGQAEDESLTASLENSLQGQGFLPESSDSLVTAGLLPVVETFLSDEGGSMLGTGFHLSRWNASFKVLDPRGKTVLFSEVYPVKGFGADPQRAALDARRKLRVEVIDKFSRVARDKFDNIYPGEPGGNRVY